MKELKQKFLNQRLKIEKKKLDRENSMERIKEIIAESGYLDLSEVKRSKIKDKKKPKEEKDNG